MLLQKYHYEKNYFNSVEGAIASHPPMDPPLIVGPFHIMRKPTFALPYSCMAL